MKTKRLQLRSAVARQTKLAVDREAGVIRHVSVITKGEANGHGFSIDDTTLKQVSDAINASAKGVKSRLTHAEQEGIDPIRVMAGKFQNATIEGDQVFADFHIGKYAQHSPEGNLAEYLLGLAEDAPESVGTSIHTNDYDIEDGALRVLSLAHIDWVGTPAANPAGMLCDGAYYPIDPLQGTGMNDQQIQYLRSAGLPYDASEEQTVAFIEALSDDQKAQLKALATSSAITDAIDSATEGAAMSAKPNTPNGSAAAGTSAEGAAQQPAAGATNPAQNSTEGASLAAKPSVSAKSEPAVSLASLSELNDLAVLSDLGADWAMKLALEGVSLADARKIALAEKAKSRKPLALSGSGIHVGEDLNLSTLAQAAGDALMIKCGNSSIPEFDQDKRPIMLSRGKIKTRDAHDRARDFKNLSLMEMGRQYLISLGLKAASSMSKSDLSGILLNRQRCREVMQKHGVALSMATTDFASILADSMGKTLRQGYVVQPSTWPLWARKATAPDFKTIRRAQLSEAPTLISMPEGDEYEYGTMTDGAETYNLGKYGKGVQFTREAMINDDLDAFSRVPALMGRAASRLEETIAIGILTANAVLSDSIALFATGHANLTTGALSVASLGTARAAMRKQTPLGGTSAQPLGTMPKVLLVPEELAVTAAQLIGSQVDPAKSNSTPNPFVNVLDVASSALLSVSSAAIWYLLADPNEIDTVEVSFLDGEEGPTVEEEVNFDNDALKLKVRHHVAAKAIDYRGMVRSSGS